MQSNNTHTFKHFVELTLKNQVGSGIGNDVMWAYAGALSDLPDVTEFANFYQ